MDLFLLLFLSLLVPFLVGGTAVEVPLGVCRYRQCRGTHNQ
jgi:hypothetical protein